MFNNVHNFEVHTFEPNIRLIRLFSLMLNYAKRRIINFPLGSFESFGESLRHNRITLKLMVSFFNSFNAILCFKLL